MPTDWSSQEDKRMDVKYYEGERPQCMLAIPCWRQHNQHLTKYKECMDPEYCGDVLNAPR